MLCSLLVRGAVGQPCNHWYSALSASSIVSVKLQAKSLIRAQSSFETDVVHTHELDEEVAPFSNSQFR